MAIGVVGGWNWGWGGWARLGGKGRGGVSMS